MAFDAIERYVVGGARDKVIARVNSVFQPLIDIVNQFGLQGNQIGGVPVLTLIEQGKKQLTDQLLPQQYAQDAAAFIAAAQKVITP